jgi:PDZ domain
MTRLGVALAVGLLVTAVPARAPGAPAADERGTYLGALFGPVPEAVFDRLPGLPRNRAVLITHVLPDSPAARADLRRQDVLLKYGDVAVRDCEHLARLIQADRPGRTVKLTLLRGGKEATAEVTLALGPALKIAPAVDKPREGVTVPRGVAKPSTSPSVSVSATPLEGSKMEVTIEYYQATGRLRTVTCQGEPGDIDKAVQKLPERERNLVHIALERIRAFNSTKPSGPPAASR